MTSSIDLFCTFERKPLQLLCYWHWLLLTRYVKTTLIIRCATTKCHSLNNTHAVAPTYVTPKWACIVIDGLKHKSTWMRMDMQCQRFILAALPCLTIADHQLFLLFLLLLLLLHFLWRGWSAYNMRLLSSNSSFIDSIDLYCTPSQLCAAQRAKVATAAPTISCNI